MGRDTSPSTTLIRRQITMDAWGLQYIAEVGENDEAQAEAQAEGQTKLEAATRRMLLIAFCSARLQDGVTLVTTCWPEVCFQTACLLARKSWKPNASASTVSCFGGHFMRGFRGSPYRREAGLSAVR